MSCQARDEQDEHSLFASTSQAQRRQRGRGLTALRAVSQLVSQLAPAFLQGLLSLVRYGAEDEVRTRDPLLGKEMLYH